MPTTIHKAIEIKASIEQVWHYVGNEAGLRQWWGSELTFEAKQGGRCAERSLYNGQTLDWVGQVTVYAPPHHLVLGLRRVDVPATWPALTILSITLQESAGRTVITLEHQAFGTMAAEPAIEWPIPSALAPKPTHHSILNQWPSHEGTVANKMVIAAPNITGSTALDAISVPARIWLREGEIRCARSFDILKQVINEV